MHLSIQLLPPNTSPIEFTEIHQSTSQSQCELETPFDSEPIQLPGQQSSHFIKTANPSISIESPALGVSASWGGSKRMRYSNTHASVNPVTRPPSNDQFTPTNQVLCTPTPLSSVLIQTVIGKGALARRQQRKRFPGYPIFGRKTSSCRGDQNSQKETQ